MWVYVGLIIDLLILHYVGTHLSGRRFFGKKLPKLEGFEFWFVVLVFVMISVNAVSGIIKILTA